MVASTKAPSNRAHLRILCEFASVALAHAEVWNVLVRSRVIDNSAFPMEMMVDYVRVYTF